MRLLSHRGGRQCPISRENSSRCLSPARAIAQQPSDCRACRASCVGGRAQPNSRQRPLWSAQAPKPRPLSSFRATLVIGIITLCANALWTPPAHQHGRVPAVFLLASRSEHNRRKPLGPPPRGQESYSHNDHSSAQGCELRIRSYQRYATCQPRRW